MGNDTVTAKDERPVVLVVEDEALTIMDLSDVLDAAGYEALQSASAERALGLLTARTDIVALITDVELSGKTDGFDLARAAEQMRARPADRRRLGAQQAGSGADAVPCPLRRPALPRRRHPRRPQDPDEDPERAASGRGDGRARCGGSASQTSTGAQADPKSRIRLRSRRAGWPASAGMSTVSPTARRTPSILHRPRVR